MPAAVKLKLKPAPKSKPARSRGRPRLEDVAEIERRLLSVALKEFIEHGYGGTSMRRIVIAAKISKTTLYSRFPSKEDLFHALIVDQTDGFKAAEVFAAAAGSLTLEQGLKLYANRTQEISLKGDLLSVNRLIYSESHRFPELGAAAAKRSKMGVDQVARFIRARAEIDKIPCKDPEGVAEAFIMMQRGWYVNHILANRKVSAALREQWVDRSVHTFISARADW